MPILIVARSPLTAPCHGARLRRSAPRSVAVCVLVACACSAHRAFVGVRSSMQQIARKARPSVGLIAASGSEEQTPGVQAQDEASVLQEPDVSGAPGISAQADAQTRATPRALLDRLIQERMRCSIAGGDIIYTAKESQVTVQLPILSLGEPLEFTVKTPQEISGSNKGLQLAAAAALQALPSWFSALSEDDFAKLRQRKEAQSDVMRSQNPKVQLQVLLQAALRKQVALNFTKIGRGETVLRIQGLETGKGAMLEFVGKSSSTLRALKAAEQQAAQAALDELRPTLEALANEKARKTLVGTGSSWSLTERDKEELLLEADAFGKEIVAKLSAAGKSVDMELSRGRVLMLLPALARLPEEWHASAQLRPTEENNGTKQYMLRLTRDDPVGNGVVDSLKVAAGTMPSKLAAYLRLKLDELSKRDSEQDAGTVEMTFTGAGAGRAAANAIKAIRLVQGSLLANASSLRFAPRYTTQRTNSTDVQSMAVAIALS